jgi:hypothetical protein
MNFTSFKLEKNISNINFSKMSKYCDTVNSAYQPGMDDSAGNLSNTGLGESNPEFDTEKHHPYSFKGESLAHGREDIRPDRDQTHHHTKEHGHERKDSR